MTLRKYLLAILGLLSACTPAVRDAGPVTQSAQITENALIMPDGSRLPLRSWLPEGEPQAIILALHGFNDYSKSYEEPGKIWAAQGIAAFAYDQRGFGEAPNVGYWAGTETLTGDLATAARLLADRYPDKPLYLLGESMGGAIVMVAQSRLSGSQALPVTGVILSAPAVWGRSSMSIFQQGLLFVASYTVPWLTLTGHGLNIWPSDNIEMLRALGRDPLVIKETRVDAVHGLCDLMDEAAASASRQHGALLMLYGDQDQVVPPEPSFAVMAELPEKSVTALYPHGYHMLMRDLQARVVLDDIASWILHRTLPSGADHYAAERRLRP